jgi:hypothetical protein
MTGPRWQQVETVLQAALAMNPPERAAYLAQACAGDADLYAEVTSLLGHEATVDGFLSTPAAATLAGPPGSPAPIVSVGQQFGPFTILGLLGIGGMGEVYRARDSRLDRDVAIKMLPREFAADADRIVRFEREAKMLAALNHPHIGAIYGLETIDGKPALVLELVEGPTLAERVASGPLPVPNVLTLASQIADALDAAHRQGIATSNRPTSRSRRAIGSSSSISVWPRGSSAMTAPNGRQCQHRR